MFLQSILPLLCFSFISYAVTQDVNNYPLVGILTIPGEGWNGYNSTEWSYFASSYVKFLESAGAQVVPVQWDLPTDQLDALLGKLNGILFTGGGTPGLSNTTNPAPIYAVFQHIVNYVLDQNANGAYYPLWGTCQGYEVVARVLANNMTILTKCDECIYVNRNNYPVASYVSRMLQGLPYDLQQKITYANLSLFDQSFKLDIAAFTENPTLGGNVTPVAYAIDQSQVTYVSMFESPKYPIYGIQFHQEKSTFEWKSTLTINHGVDSVRFEQFLGNFFVNEARKNFNTFPDNQTYLIYNYNASVSSDSPFEGVYYFPVNNSTKLMENEINEEVTSETKTHGLVNYLRKTLGLESESVETEDLFDMIINAADEFLGRW